MALEQTLTRMEAYSVRCTEPHPFVLFVLPCPTNAAGAFSLDYQYTTSSLAAKDWRSGNAASCPPTYMVSRLLPSHMVTRLLPCPYGL